MVVGRMKAARRNCRELVMTTSFLFGASPAPYRAGAASLATLTRNRCSPRGSTCRRPWPMIDIDGIYHLRLGNVGHRNGQTFQTWTQSGCAPAERISHAGHGGAGTPDRARRALGADRRAVRCEGMVR